MKFYVYYNDINGMGLKEFDTEEGALQFLSERIRTADIHNKLNLNYKLIKGTSLPLEPEEQITRVRVKRG